MALVHQTRVVAYVDGNNLGVFQYKSGGDADSDEVKNRPGAMLDQVALGGPSTTSNVVVRKMFDPAMQALAHSLASKVGLASMTVQEQFLDADKNVTGSVTYKGILKRCTYPDADSDTAGTAFLELELSTNANVT